MIHTTLSIEKITQELASLNLHQERVLRTYAGFADTSAAAGEPRQTFSLVLSQADIASITSDMQQLYKRITSDIKGAGRIPFDFVRTDVYYHPENHQLQLLEINAQGAGMHEIVEWLDNKTSRMLNAPTPRSLNHAIAQSQKTWHEERFGHIQRALYISKPEIPRWLYFDALDMLYPELADAEGWDGVSVAEDGLCFEGLTYNSIILKASGPRSTGVDKKELNGVISIVQPQTNRQVGYKDYLQELDFPFVAKVRPYVPSQRPVYEKDQHDLVLKKINSNGSKGVVIGKSSSVEVWSSSLDKVDAVSQDWVIQDYIQAGGGHIVPHNAPLPEKYCVQLGIFLLPNLSSPTEVVIDIVAKVYAGESEAVLFDPAGEKPEIWFGNVIVTP